MLARERERVADTCLNAKFGSLFTYFAMPRNMSVARPSTLRPHNSSSFAACVAIVSSISGVPAMP